MDLQAKHERFYELLNGIRKDLTEERAACLAARMEYGNGHQFFHDALESLYDNMGDDEEAAESMLDDGISYLESLAKATIDESIHSNLKEEV